MYFKTISNLFQRDYVFAVLANLIKSKPNLTKKNLVVGKWWEPVGQRASAGKGRESIINDGLCYTLIVFLFLSLSVVIQVSCINNYYKIKPLSGLSPNPQPHALRCTQRIGTRRLSRHLFPPDTITRARGYWKQLVFFPTTSFLLFWNLPLMAEKIIEVFLWRWNTECKIHFT